MDKFRVKGRMRPRHDRKYSSTRPWVLARKLVLGLVLALACQSALAQVLYRMTLLLQFGGCTGSPVAEGFNASGQVAVESCNGQGGQEAFLWKNDGNPAVALGPPEAQSQSYAAGINTAGQVTGYAVDSTGFFGFISSGSLMKRIYDDMGGNAVYPTDINDLAQLTGNADTAGGATHAFLWRNNGSPLVDLGTLGGGVNSFGYAINGSGQVTGLSDSSAGPRAFVWKNNGTPMQNLGTLGGDNSQGVAINASGQVIGYSSLAPNKNTGPHAFLWRNNGTPLQDLGTLGGDDSYPAALNQAGQVAGYSNTQGTSQAHAFVWTDNGMPMQDLGTFGGHRSKANDINPSGQVVGWATITGDAIAHAFLWRNDGSKLQDLNSLIDATDPLQPYITLTDARYINRRGDVVAKGLDSRNSRIALYLLRGTVLMLAPRSLAFGNQPINTTSAAKSVTVTNTSAKAVAITSIALAGSAPGQFGSTNNCGKSLAGHASCKINVTFKPTTKGAKSAVLNVNGGNGGLTSVSLSGKGT